MVAMSDYLRSDGKYRFLGKETADELLELIALGREPDAEGIALFYLSGHIQGLKLKAKDKLAVGEALTVALFEGMSKERPLLLSALEKSLRLHKKVALTNVDAYLDVFMAGPNGNVALDKLFAFCVRHAEDKEGIARRFEAILPPSALRIPIGGKKFPVLVHRFFVDHGLSPTDLAVFSPFPAQQTEAMAGIAELPFLPLEPADKMVFREPLGTKTKEAAPSYQTRFLMAWLKGIPESHGCRLAPWDEPVTISFTRGENYLIKNKCYVGIGWVEPYQYNLVIEHKHGFLCVVDHETMELRSAGSIDHILTKG